MDKNKLKILLISLGVIIILLSNWIYGILYPEGRTEIFEITKTISIIFIGLIISISGLLISVEREKE